MESIEAYPLQWPPERKRTPYHARKRAPFHTKSTTTRQGQTFTSNNKLTIGNSRDRVMKELGLLGGRNVIISSNLQLRGDGLPLSAQREPEDPGVAVYFQLDKQPRCVSCDRWDRAADNLAAIAKFVEAMRGQLRWGVGDVSAMFAGFKALPGGVEGTSAAIATVEQAGAKLASYGGVAASDVINSADTYRRCFKVAAIKLHPDVNDGQHLPEWNLLMQAKEILERHHKL